MAEWYWVLYEETHRLVRQHNPPNADDICRGVYEHWYQDPKNGRAFVRMCLNASSKGASIDWLLDLISHIVMGYQNNPEVTEMLKRSEQMKRAEEGKET